MLAVAKQQLLHRQRCRINFGMTTIGPRPQIMLATLAVRFLHSHVGLTPVPTMEAPGGQQVPTPQRLLAHDRQCATSVPWFTDAGWPHHGSKGRSSRDEAYFPQVAGRIWSEFRMIAFVYGLRGASASKSFSVSSSQACMSFFALRWLAIANCKMAACSGETVRCTSLPPFMWPHS